MIVELLVYPLGNYAEDECQPKYAELITVRSNLLTDTQTCDKIGFLISF
jgi:hypothetical protein